MFSWGTKRQIIFTTIAILFFLLAVSIPIYFKFIKHTPTCFDNILNQDERGVDCGGACAKICPDEARPLVVHFERVFKSLDGVYSVIAMIENVNRSVYATDVPYYFKVYDDEGVLLEERRGTVLIPPSRTFPIFEYAIYAGERLPKNTTITFPEPIKWVKGSYVEPFVKISGQTFETIDGKSIVKASLYNSEVYDIKNIVNIAMIYDKENNLLKASQTVIDQLNTQTQRDVTFTWNEVFDFDIGHIDITPLLVPRDL